MGQRVGGQRGRREAEDDMGSMAEGVQKVGNVSRRVSSSSNREKQPGGAAFNHLLHSLHLQTGLFLNPGTGRVKAQAGNLQ